MEPFQPGESVTLTDSAPAIGHILSVSPDGSSLEIRWLRRPGHDHAVTVEPAATVRRMHESEDGTI
jgi:hypothetical protein